MDDVKYSKTRPPKIILGISGKAGVGKDTLASMLAYIHNFGDNASYKKWVIYDKYKNVFHFSDILKDVISDMFDINRSLLDNRCFKEQSVINLKTLIVKDYPAKSDTIISIDELKGKTIKEVVNDIDKPVCTIRTLMQYVGTEMFRDRFNDGIFIKTTIRNAIKKLNNYDLVMIADVRFANEINAIKSIPYGRIVTIKNDRVGNDDSCNHISEQIPQIYDYEIDNNGDKEALFEGAKELYNLLYKQ